MTSLKLRAETVGNVPLTAADHDENMLRLYGFADLAALLADDERDYDFYAAGSTVFTLAEGFRYEVAASGATDHHLITAADLKLYVLPSDDGSWNVLAFGAAGDDATDDLLPFRRALKAAAGGILRIPRKTYYCSKVWEIWWPTYIEADQGAVLRVPGGTDGMIIHHLWSAGHSAIAAKNMTGAAMLAYHAGLVKYEGEVYRANYGISAANLKAETPGTGTRWVHMRSVEGRDSVVATWTAEGPNGSGNFQVINPGQLDPTNHLPLPGMYVLCQTDGVYYQAAEPDAEDHDELTMFDVKLYAVDPAEYPSYTTAAGTIIDNLEIDGTDPTVMTPDGTPAHGVWLRVKAQLRNVKVRNFSGNGIQAVAAVTGEAPNAPDVWGNCNCFMLENCEADSNGEAGFLAWGSDANAGDVIGGRYTKNGRYGVFDATFLGVTHVGYLTEGNGIGTSAGSIAGSIVSHGGQLYRAVYATNGTTLKGALDPAQLGLLVSTTPGNDAEVWEAIEIEGQDGSPTEAYPAWAAEQTEGTYYPGASIAMVNQNARSLLVNCKTGPEEPGCLFYGNTQLVLGGDLAAISMGSQVRGRDGGHLEAASFAVIAGATKASIGGVPHSEGHDLVFRTERDDPTKRWDIRWYEHNIGFHQYEQVAGSLVFTGEETTDQFGTGVSQPFLPWFPRGYAVGTGSNARRHWIATAAPASGAWARGDVVYNQNPSAGGTFGWICVTSGTPGTWKAISGIAS